MMAAIVSWELLLGEIKPDATTKGFACPANTIMSQDRYAISLADTKLQEL